MKVILVLLLAVSALLVPVGFGVDFVGTVHAEGSAGGE